MSANKVAACIITGDQYEDQEVKDLLASLEGHVDGVFVNYNGSKRKLNWQSWTSIPVTYKKFKWEDDFALARNQSFSLVPKNEFDWYLWLDTDDKLVVDGGVKEMLESLDEYTEGVFIRYAYAVEPDSGIVVVEQWRERFLSTKIAWNWLYKVHEVCRAPGPIQYAKRDSVYVEHQRKNGEDRGARERNRRIIAKALVDFPYENRYLFYFAAETMAEADIEEDPKTKLELVDGAILAYERYREAVNEANEDVYMATTRIAELYRMKKDFAASLESDLEAIALYADWPDGYVGAAKTCLEIRDFRRMKAFADMASRCNKPDTSASIEPMMAGFTPIFLRAIANEELGHYIEAVNDYKLALTYWTPPDNDAIQQKMEYLEELGNAPEDKDVRKSLRGTKKDKSICFFTQPIPDVWHPETLKEGGSGGAELCIMRLAPMFEKDGWRVVVFGTPGPYRGVHEGVEYWNTEEYNSQEEFSVLVSSRSVVPFQDTIKSKTSFLWMHDVNIGENPSPLMNKPDKVVGLTQWHANHLHKLYNIDKDKMTIIPNGIDLDRFPVEKWNNEANSNKLIYSSSPDRGLEQMLGMWEMLKGRYPDLELHIYYGWTIIDKIVEYMANMGQEHHLKQFKNKMLHHIDFLGGEDGGIYQHGRVNQEQLADAMMNSLIWSYPTQFMETFGITAIEMQAAGVIPVTSRLAALQETVSPFYDTLTGWPANSDYQKRFLGSLAFALEIDEFRVDGRREGREHAEKYSWENAYKIWNENIREVLR